MSKSLNIPAEIPNVRNIAISGRIGTGKSTLAQNLADALGWEILDGGKIFRKYASEYGFHISKTGKIPDEFDKAFEEKTKQILETQKHFILQSHLAGFIAQGINGVYKVLVECVDNNGQDEQGIRIDRIMNRDIVSSKEAIEEVKVREERLLNKFRRLYIEDDPNWVYWDKKYFDLVVNTFYLNQKEAVESVLKKLLV